jgi:glycosyltransferase involved in cell wall biosynthesis
MKIAVWHNLPSGGSKRALHQQIQGLLARGHQVECWCPSTANRSYLKLDALCPEHTLDIAWPTAGGSSKIFNWHQDRRLILAGLRAMRQHCEDCAAQINRGGFDVLFANTCAAFAVSPIGNFVKLPKVLYLGEPHRKLYEAMPELLWAAPPASASWLRVLANTYRLHAFRVQVREEIANARQFDRILVNSFFTRENLLRAYGLESEVCYLGIDTELFQPTGEPVENHVIGLGMIGYHKGIDRALRAVAAIPAQERPKLIWVGNISDEKYLGELKKLADELKVDFEIKIMVKDAELVSLLNRAKLMLYTSRLEPFGLAPLEANACGVPVVAVPEGGVRETIVDGQNGLLAASASAPDLADAMLKILKNPGLASTMRAQARELVLARWKMEPAIDRLEGALQQTIKNFRMISTKP